MAIILDGSNGLIIPLGSSSNPSLRSTDSDTGFYFNSNTEVSLSFDGTPKTSFYANGLSSFGNVSTTGITGSTATLSGAVAADSAAITNALTAQSLVVNNATQLFANGDATVTGSLGVSGNVTVRAQGDVRFADADSNRFVAVHAPSVVSSNITFTLPGTDGATNQVMTTDGAGNLSFTSKATIGEAIAMSIVFGGG